MGTARRLQATVAVLAAVMLFASLLAIVQRTDFVESVAVAPQRELVNPADTLTNADAALLDQLARVGNGITLEGGTASIDGRFMLSGAAFETDSGSAFSVVTSSWMGTELTAAVEPVLEGDRVIYERDGFTEWWIRDGRSYEQGWTVDAPPANGSTDLTLDVVFEGAATTQLSPTTIELILGDGSRVWYRNLHAFDAEGTTLPAYMTSQGSRVTVTVEAEGAVYPVTIDPIITEDQALIPPDSSTGDFFGEAIATDGSLMIVSVRGADRNVADQGRAEVYQWNGTGYDFVDELLGPVFDDNTDFGWDVDINETAGLAIVGAPGDDENGVDAGAAFIYEVDAFGAWSLIHEVYECDTAAVSECGDTAAGGFDGSQFGKSVAIANSGRVVIGAPGAKGGEGRAFVYEPLPLVSPTSFPWQTTLSRELAASTGPLSAGDRYGEAVDISADGTFVIAGVPGNPVGVASNSGTVVLSTETAPGVWAGVDGDNGPSSNDGQEHGSSVAIGEASNGDRIVVAGRPFRTREDQGDSGVGGVRVYRITGAAGSEQLTTVGLGDITSPVAAPGEGMGFSVAFDTESDQVIVGAPFNAGVGPERGLVRTYLYNTATGGMDNGGAGASAAQLGLPSDWPTATGLDQYGFSVAAGPGVDETYVTGSPGWVQTVPRRSPQAGRVTTTGPNFSSVFTTVEVVNASAHDKLGFAVAISGNRMAASAIGDDERTSQNGLVYTYERANDAAPWVLDQLIVDPTPTDDAKPFGFSLDMDGDFLAIGSPGGDGQVDVFEFDGNAWVLQGSVTGDAADNVSKELEFGYDVAIAGAGEMLFVGVPGHDNVCGSLDCGAVEVFYWDGAQYADFDTVAINHGEEDDQRYGHSIDADVIPGTGDVRLVAGYLLNSSGVDTWIRASGTLPPTPLQLEESFGGATNVGQAVAIDGNRIVASSTLGGVDTVVVYDTNGPNENWDAQVRFISSVLAGDAADPDANKFVDVSGDTIVVGRGAGGGEVGIYYNDPAYGWGIADTVAGWAPGPVDRIQPTFRQVGHEVGKAVAIDGAGAEKSIVFGSIGRDTNGVDAGTVYANSFTETGTPEPANKVTFDDFSGNAQFGTSIAIKSGTPQTALVGESGGGRAHHLQFIGGSWTIASTFDFPTEVIDVDIAADGKAVVLDRSGTVTFYQEVCVGGGLGGIETCSLAPTGVTGSNIGGVPASVSISGSDVLIGTPDGGDPLSQIPFADGSNLPTGGPPGVTAADEFGASMDSTADLTFIGAPGTSGDDGVVHIYSGISLSYVDTIVAPAGTGSAGRFGESVAISGETLVVGAPSINSDGSFDGEAYVFSVVEVGLGAVQITLEDTLEPTAGSGLSAWGTSVDIDGDVIVIGATGYEESGIPFRDGTAVGFGFDGTDWVETDRFDHTDDAGADQAGSAVGVAGTNVLVGVPSDDNPQGQNAGAVYSYTATPADPAVANRLLANSATSSGFGRHIDIDGSVAVITEHDGGAMQIYDLVGSDWVFRQRIDSFAGSVRDVSIDGTRLAVIDRIGNELFLFEETGGTFSAFATRSLGNGVPESVVLDGDDIFVGLLSSAADLPIEHHVWAGGTVTVPTLAGSADAGWSIAKEGNLVFVGARFWDDTPDDNAGRVHIYDTSVPAWTGIITADQAGTLFGSDLSASNGRLVVGYQGGEGPDPTGPNPTDFTGIAEVYNNLTPTGADLEQVITGSNQDIADSFGKKVAIDGDIIAVGATATSYNGVRRGQVVMFAFNGTSFVEAETFRSDTDSTGTDQFGHDVAVDGLNVIAGAFQHDNARGSDAGAAYYFTSAGVPIVDDPALTFSLDLGPGSPASVQVAPAGIAVSEFNEELLEASADDESSIAAASFESTDVGSTPLSSLPLSSLPLSSLAATPGSAVSTIPLVEISLEGGWEQLFEDAGSNLADVPLADLNLADVANDPAARNELDNQRELGDLNVRGTPLSSLPLSSLVLGNTPLSSLSGDVDWCTLLDGFIADICGARDLSTVTLVEASLSGVPLSSLPLSSLPLSSLPLSSLPLSSLELGEIALQESPLSSLPLSSLPLSSLGPVGTPLSSLPLSSLPLSSLPLSSLELGGTPLSSLPLSSLPLSSLELSSVPLSSLPLSSLPLSSLPLSSLPLSSLVLADAPLSSLPLSSLDASLPDWCTYLEGLDIGYDCTYAEDEATFLANTTIAELGVQGVPLSSLPLSSLPLSSLAVNGAPLSSLPLSSLPLSSLPLSSLPLSSLPLSSLDLSTTPLSSLGASLESVPLSSLDVAGSPLSSLPLSSLDLAGTPLSSLPLSSLPLSSLPLSSLPLSSLDVAGSPLSSLPLSSLDLADSPLSSLPLSSLPLSSLAPGGLPLSSLADCALVDCEIDSLGDAIQSGALDPASIPLSSLQPYLSGIRLGDIADLITDGTVRADVEAGVLALPGTETLGVQLTLDDLTLGDLPLSLIEVQNTVLGDLEGSLWAVRLADLIGFTIDPATGQPFTDTVMQDALEEALGSATVANIENLGDATVGDLLAGDDGSFTFAELGPILNLVNVVDLIPLLAPDAGATLGDLTEPQLQDLTLLDLIGLNEANFDDITLTDLLVAAGDAELLYGFDVADLLLALIGVETLPFSNLDFTEVEVGQLPADVLPPVTFAAVFEVTGTQLRKSVDVTVQIPATATYLPESAVVSTAGGNETIEPVQSGNSLTWTLTSVDPDTETTISFDVKPTVTIGSTSISGTANIVGTDIGLFGDAEVAVVEGLEPNDFPTATTATENNVYLTYISSEDDVDVFSITVSENDELAIQLSSLSADLDFALYGRPSDPNVGTALSGASDEAPLQPITNPDQDVTEAEVVNDFRRLDEEDPTLQLIGVSNAPGLETELLVTEALAAGTYYVQVFGANGATNEEPAALQIQVLEADARPNCAAVGAGTITAGAGTDQAGPADANTVFLVNQRRMEHYYGQAGLDTIDAVKDFATYLNGANGPAGVSASVISVDGNGAIRTAYDAWDADAGCSPESVNGVVSAINDVLDPLRGDLEHIVVVGGDPIIPMARLLDATEIANEYDFRHEFIGDNIVGGNAGDINALSASFWDRVYLSDEPYGETAARDLGNRFLYVSDAAIGRLVETPAEIQGMLSHFENFDGELDAQTAAVLGYDFLVDSSEQISADLVAAGLTVDDELADGLDPGGDKWDRVDAENKVVPAGGADDLISLNGHFDHYRALPADGDQVPNFTNNFLADTVLNAAPGLLEGSIVFSMGCHGGLSVSDLQIGDAGDNTNGDWAQTFAADQAIFLGNTGFGYGDTEAVAYTEALLARFAELAVRPTDLGGGQQTTIGQALTFAKNDYASDLSVFSVYDEKALMEMTFYGLPFYTVDLTTVDAAPIPDSTTSPDATGLASVGVNADATNTLDDTNDRGDFYSNPDENGDPQTIVTPGRPIQPSLSTDVSVVDPADTASLESIAHGAVILGMDSTYVAPIDPVIAAVVFNESADAPEPPIGDVVFPAKPVTINTATTPGGQRQSLVLATGQFDSEGSTQRLDDNINAVVYYSDPAETDFDAPIVGVVESNFDPVSNQLTITLSATDTASDVVRIYVLAAADPGAGSVTWTGLDLVQTAGTDEWSGSLNLPGSEVEFLIQAVDSAGNVGFATNKARNFNDDGTEEPEPPSPDLTVTVPAAGTAEGWYTGPVAVTVDSGDLDATYEISPGTASTDVLNGGFTIDGQGTFDWTVTRADGQTESGTVEIDSTAPSATLAPPEDGAAYEVSQVPAVGFVCTDPSLQTCAASVTGPAGTESLASGDALPTDLGSYTVTVTATDVFGNQASDSASYTVVADPLDDLVVTVSPANLDIGSGLYTGDVEVTVESGDADTEYTLNGGTPVTLAAPGGTFTITAEEVTEYVVTRPADGATDDGSVEIDTTAPTATLIAPADGAVFTPGNVPVIDFDCADRNPGTCEATVDGAPVALGDALPDTAGTYTIAVTATDAVDLETTVSGSYTVEVVAGDPIVITDIEIDGVEQQGELVDIWGSFTGGVAPYTIAVDWGDGSTCADGTCAIEAPTVDEDGMFDASYAYANGGEQTVTVTITDAAGTSIVETLSTATCTIVGTSGRDVLRGTSGDDVICGLGGNDRLYGRGGNDIIFGGSGRDRIYGQNGDDQLFGGRDNDILYGSFGDDVMSGGRGVDTLIAGDGDDILKGRQDNDWMYGQNDNDTLIGNRGNDRMFGGSGVDVLDGRRGNDRMYGQAGNDTMDGGNGNDLMYGGNGDDTMNGENGGDNVNGGRGDDVIDGGAGSDRCRGNAGSDTLVGCET